MTVLSPGQRAAHAVAARMVLAKLAGSPGKRAARKVAAKRPRKRRQRSRTFGEATQLARVRMAARQGNRNELKHKTRQGETFSPTGQEPRDTEPGT